MSTWIKETDAVEMIEYAQSFHMPNTPEYETYEDAIGIIKQLAELGPRDMMLAGCQLIQSLRSTQSRSKRTLLDKAADTIEGLLKAAENSKSEWHYIKQGQLPPEDVAVLVRVTGDYRPGIEFEDALEVATYTENEGWILEGWPLWENPPVTCWAYGPVY